MDTPRKESLEWLRLEEIARLRRMFGAFQWPEKICGNWYRGFTCTLSQKHLGKHISQTPNGITIAIWGR